MRMPAGRLSLYAAAFGAALGLGGSSASAAIIFDDFNVNEGHFNLAPNFSGTSVGESSTSTADRVTTEGPLEGAGHQKLVLVHDGTATNMRIRHLSGSGTVANNTPFTTSAGTDGFIGFYAKTTNTGWTIALNLDGADGAGASMDMGTPKPMNSSGEWTLYEWNLDDNTQWDPVTSIGGNGTIEDGQHSIDSIYIFTNQTGTNGQAREPLYIDFVALNEAGSIANLIPEPASMGLIALAAAGMMRGRRRMA